jgi:(2Fe-2S) ferredoxin
MEIIMKPTLKTYPDGRQAWFLNDNLHREDGPAVIYPDGTQYWCINGNIHREDGPAIVYPDGYQEWRLNGKHITKDVTNWANERNIDLNNMSDTDKMVLKIELKMWK